MPEWMVFLAQAVVISLSGVMSPGAVTAATLAHGARRRHAGALMAIGHGVIEFPLMALILLGIGAMLESPAVQVGIGLAGGVFLVFTGVQMLLSGRRVDASIPAPPARSGPLMTGIILTAGNPYFLLWWATVGLALATRAAELGAIVFAIFAVTHWLCDLIWLEVLSLGSFHGNRRVGGRLAAYILVACAAAMIAFGGWFLLDAGGKLLG